jgi:Ca2+-dependent lipid-binding protein
MTRRAHWNTIGLLDRLWHQYLYYVFASCVISLCLGKYIIDVCSDVFVIMLFDMQLYSLGTSYDRIVPT